MRTTRLFSLIAVAVLIGLGITELLQSPGNTSIVAHAEEATPNLSVGPQYGTAHVYIAPKDFDRFVSALLATFGGSSSKPAVITVTPTPSSTMWQAVSTPVGNFSVFAFQTPIPYPFGAERTGYLVADMDAATRAARSDGADVLVSPFNDPIGRDVIIQWPGGVNMQLYWHTTPSSAAPLQTTPENRVYVSADRVAAFIRSFLAFSRGKVISDEAHAPGVEIGRPTDTYRRIRIQSNFGRMTVLVTDGHLPYPYGRETTGYEVANLTDALAKAKAAGVAILVATYSADQRNAAIVQFPSGYIVEIHSPIGKPSALGAGSRPVETEAHYVSSNRDGIQEAVGETLRK
jgi:hypothetical protein